MRKRKKKKRLHRTRRTPRRKMKRRLELDSRGEVQLRRDDSWIQGGWYSCGGTPRDTHYVLPAEGGSGCDPVRNHLTGCRCIVREPDVRLYACGCYVDKGCTP